MGKSGLRNLISDPQLSRPVLRSAKAVGRSSHPRERKVKLLDEQIRQLERFSPEFRERHIEAPQTGSSSTVHTSPTSAR